MFHEGAGCLGAPQKSANSLWLRLQFHWLPANLLDGSVVSARQAHFSFLTFPSAFDSGSRGGTGGAGPHNTVELANCRRLVPLKLHERRRRVENNPGRRGAHLTAAHVLQRATNCLGSQSIGRFRLGCAALVTRLAGRQAGWLAGSQVVSPRNVFENPPPNSREKSGRIRQCFATLCLPSTIQADERIAQRWLRRLLCLCSNIMITTGN